MSLPKKGGRDDKIKINGNAVINMWCEIHMRVHQTCIYWAPTVYQALFSGIGCSSKANRQSLLTYRARIIVSKIDSQQIYNHTKG